MTGLTIEQIYELARQGDPVAWQNLSGVAPDGGDAKKYLLQLESTGVCPRPEPTLSSSDGCLSKIPILGDFIRLSQEMRDMRP